MREIAPCKGCSERHPGCHDHCEEYKEWKDRYHAQLEHLKDCGFDIPMTASRETAYRAHIKAGKRRYTVPYKGGAQ